MSYINYPRQLLLDLNLGYRQTFDNFIVGANESLCQKLQEMHPLEYGYDDSLCCWSEFSNGKSHLLRAYCAYWQEFGVRVNYLSGGNLVLDDLNMESNQLMIVVFDDAHHSLGNRREEESLLYLLLQCYERDIPFVCSSNNHPSKLNFSMPDLATRFGAFYSFNLEGLQGDQLNYFIDAEARRRGVKLEPEHPGLISSVINSNNSSSMDMKMIVNLMKKLAAKKSGEVLSIADIERASTSLHH